MPTTDADQDPGWDALTRRVQAALEPFMADLGPRVCTHGDWSDCNEVNDGDGCRFNDTQPKAGSVPMLNDWVLVLTAADAASGQHDISVVAGPKQRRHATQGLLHVALYD